MIPHGLQAETNDIVRDHDLPKYLSSRLQQWNPLLPGVKVAESRTREKNIFHFFEKKEQVVACIDVNDLMNFMNISYDPNNWRLFLDSSEFSLKTLLLHNGSLLLSIPNGHSVQVKKLMQM
ncbi:uncharacterized protein TNCT_554851 [Trichonephila clavata]|uniref:Uncharacterized protein n=1 Tax=Trichonephila clavata TaxID=2740835 RepID=A0A8X6M090_TRICU|nr:uncharacterized protein TNCT_554851 [Trichonephila clavata]